MATVYEYADIVQCVYSFQIFKLNIEIWKTVHFHKHLYHYYYLNFKEILEKKLKSLRVQSELLILAFLLFKTFNFL